MFFIWRNEKDANKKIIVVEHDSVESARNYLHKLVPRRFGEVPDSWVADIAGIECYVYGLNLTLHDVKLYSQYKGWKVLRAEVSERNGGLHVSGINYESTDLLFRTFSWNIGAESLLDARYDFTNTVWGEAAFQRYRQLTDC